MQNLELYYDIVNINKFLVFNTSTFEESDSDVETIDSVVNACKVLLFNDDWHTFDEVINQIIKAIHCPYNQAEQLTIEVHEKGKAIIYSGELNECLKVSSTLEEISLHTQIEM